ncbi:MAG: anion permease [Anaerolineae bacterium]|nr:anion permease [Gemmatimonadaceae bacterium]
MKPDEQRTHANSKLPVSQYPLRALFAIVALTATVAAVAMDAPAAYRAAIIASVCVLLWLTEWVRAWVPTVILWISTPLLLGGFGAEFQPHEVLAWSADPILILFLGGFSLAAAARLQGADQVVASLTLRGSQGRPRRLVALTALATAGLSMWMSNIAAAAMMLGALQPILDGEPKESRIRRAVLLAVVLGANVGGIATPIGSGPNGIAMAAVSKHQSIGFIEWMVFGVPLTLGLLLLSVGGMIVWLRPSGATPVMSSPERPSGRLGSLAFVIGGTVILWLSEPVHGIPAWVVAIGTIIVLLASRLLRWSDVLNLDWSTLLLIAGGIGLGALLDHSGLLSNLTDRLSLDAAPPTLRLLGLCFLSAFLSSLMSNTGTAALLIPLAATFDPSPSTAIIVAISASFGMLFVVSTPPNAMAVSRGLPASDLLFPGLLLLIGGCLVVALSGPWVLQAVGIP